MTDMPVPDRPSPAGVYDYALGGRAYTEADRAYVEQVKQFIPDIILGAWANRGFLQRAVKRMAGDWGIQQFLDLGSGLPTQRNTHEIVSEAGVDGRVVYVDNDPQVITRSRAMLGAVPGAAAIEADIRNVDQVLAHPETGRLIDFTK